MKLFWAPHRDNLPQEFERRDKTEKWEKGGFYFLLVPVLNPLAPDRTLDPSCLVFHTKKPSSRRPGGFLQDVWVCEERRKRWLGQHNANNLDKLLLKWLGRMVSAETVEGGGSTSKNPLLQKHNNLGNICLRKKKKGLIWFFFFKNKPCGILTCLFSSFFSSSTTGLTTTTLSHSGTQQPMCHRSGAENYTSMKILD